MLMLTMNSFDANGFNMTDDLKEEGELLQLCIEWRIENPTCGMVYGDINNSNGEPLK